MAKPLLMNDDFCRAAKRLKCEVASIKAVASVESAGNGFYADGFPVILFERHLFRKFTQGRYSSTYPELSGPQGNYGKAGANQTRKFNLAFALSPDAAMKSCSWGKFQILGSNHAVCGYPTVGAFVDAMKESEGKQLDAFVSFVIGNNLAAHLRNLDWAKFARGYNGPKYKINNYDVKMANGYKRFAKEHIDCNSATPSPVSEPTDTQSPKANIIPEESAGSVAEQPLIQNAEQIINTGDNIAPKNEQDVNKPAVVDAAKPYNEIGLKDTLVGDAKGILPANVGLQTISEWIQQTTGWPAWVTAIIPKLALILVICTALWILYRVAAWLMHNWRENERVKLQANINSDVSRKNVELK